MLQHQIGKKPKKIIIIILTVLESPHSDDVALRPLYTPVERLDVYPVQREPTQVTHHVHGRIASRHCLYRVLDTPAVSVTVAPVIGPGEHSILDVETLNVTLRFSHLRKENIRVNIDYAQ